MSGFVGFTGELTAKGKTLNAMLETIAHRGPDNSKAYVDDCLSLGFRGLNTSNQDDNIQPVFNANADRLIVLNGTIYNRQELRTDLEESDHTFQITAGSGADAEIILAGYEEHGPAILNKLRGMWSFVIYDLRAGTLFGARDYFGIKPLYYYERQDERQDVLIFGSEIKAFTRHPAFTPEVNTKMLGTYLNFGFVPGENTMFEGVYKLPPGHYFEYDMQDSGEGMRVTEYHRPVFNPDHSKNLDDWAKIISDTIKTSVKYHKTGDAEVGSFLSSGIDSSYLAKLGNDVSPTKTFSVGYVETQYSELPFAQAFAERFGLENFAKEITSDMYFDIAEKVVYHLDEPLADPSCLSLYYVCSNASERVKVSFSGEGADELFAGYNPYRDGLRMDKYAKIPLSLRKLVGALASALPSKLPRRDFFIRGAKPLEERYFQSGNFIFSPGELQSTLLNAENITPEEVVAPFYAGTENTETVSRMQTVDLNVWAPGDILLKADKMSMANSLEVRCPLLDIEVLNLALQIPAKSKVSSSDTKISLRAAARLDIDDATAGKKKLGFPVPLRDWLRRDEYYGRVKQLCNSETARKYFNVTQLNKLIEDHKSGRADTYRKIWAVYIFLLWHQTFIED